MGVRTTRIGILAYQPLKCNRKAMTRILAAFALVAASFAMPDPARCSASWCQGQCITSQQCGQGCTCLRSGTDFGRCVSLNLAP